MEIYAVIGATTGIGSAIKKNLIGDGHEVISVDIKEADIVADLIQYTGPANGD